MRIFYLGLAVVFAAMPATSNAEGCLKKVFNKFCLGGSVKSLASTYKPRKIRKLKKERNAVILSYKIDGDNVFIYGLNGKVGRITRFYKPVNWENFNGLHKALKSKYGTGKEFMLFSISVSNGEEKERAVNRGKGEAAVLWKLDKWMADIEWSRSKKRLKPILKLTYTTDIFDKDLERRHKLAKKRKFGGL